jgi:hypothetical protein
MIGNAVPVALADVFACEIKKQLSQVLGKKAIDRKYTTIGNSLPKSRMSG